MRSRKETAWKKSRKFGDIMGGRKYNKWLNSTFDRFHNLEPLLEYDDTPVFIVDNPSRDFFFPVTKEDIQEQLKNLPDYQIKWLSYIWLKKQSQKEFDNENSLQGCYIWGGGIQLITLYSFPNDLKMNFGKKRPKQSTLNWYKAFCSRLVEEKQNWYLQWTKEEIKNYYLNGLLLHEIGHHIDNQYKYSIASITKAEKWADNYALYWSNKIRENIEPIK
ncbi:MAG: hypothetical protein GQ574_15850 [Crocinitomix sp.]|nr:hypothetical protein [Crocinitomix sp.]